MKKYLAFIIALAGLVTLASAVIVRREPDALDRIKAAAVPIGNVTFSTATLPNGCHRISLYSNGRFAGSITEARPGHPESLIFADSTSTPIPESRLLDTKTDALNRRAVPLILLRLFAALIRRFGPRFVNFITCLGSRVGALCADKIIRCATVGEAPWECFSGIVCGGKQFRACL